MILKEEYRFDQIQIIVEKANAVSCLNLEFPRKVDESEY